VTAQTGNASRWPSEILSPAVPVAKKRSAGNWPSPREPRVVPRRQGSPLDWPDRARHTASSEAWLYAQSRPRPISAIANPITGPRATPQGAALSSGEGPGGRGPSWHSELRKPILMASFARRLVAFGFASGPSVMTRGHVRKCARPRTKGLIEGGTGGTGPDHSSHTLAGRRRRAPGGTKLRAQPRPVNGPSGPVSVVHRLGAVGRRRGG
jgi:hypothetical protein